MKKIDLGIVLLILFYIFIIEKYNEYVVEILLDNNLSKCGNL